MVLDKSACVLVADILGTATGDVQPAMDAVASLAAAELHPGGKDGEVRCHRETGGTAALATETPISGNTARKSLLMIIHSPPIYSTLMLLTLTLILTVF